MTYSRILLYIYNILLYWPVRAKGKLNKHGINFTTVNCNDVNKFGKALFYFTPFKKGINVFAVLEEACSSLMVSAQDFRLSVLGLRPGLGCCVILFALNQCLSTNTGLSLTFSAREQQVHRWAKLFELNFFVRRIFPKWSDRV